MASTGMLHSCHMILTFEVDTCCLSQARISMRDAIWIAHFMLSAFGHDRQTDSATTVKKRDGKGA